MNIYLSVFNQYTWPLAMSEFLTKQGHEVWWVDNNSTYEPLLDAYASQFPYKVLRLPYNGGGCVSWTLLGKELPNDDYFVISDTDYLMDGLPDDWHLHLIEGVKRYAGQGGCGLSMLETRIPSQNPAWIADEFHMYPQGNHPARWGPGVKLDGGFIRFPVDTSFAVYPPGTQNFMTSSTGCRSDFPYSVRHIPWHVVLDLNPEEDSYQVLFDDEYLHYLQQTAKAGAYTGTGPRMVPFVAEYGRRKAERTA